MALIEINGKKIEAETGSMIIEVADVHHIQIPRFCYHKKLSIAANCRMCLVEVEKAPKPLPACATPITEGMKIWTHSPKVLQAQKSVMEFLLINHPLDCPICDQGGECELQDLSLGYGSDTSRYSEGKRSVKDKDLGPLIATDMTRCIHCTRCVRFGSEVAGIREMGGTGRGECTEIGTYVEKTVCSEVSGNIIDLCPVGALTSKPFRFTARGWELKQTASVAPHDSVGSNIYVQTRRGEVMRIVPKENEAINEIWISDRDRYSYEGLLSEDRLLQPKIKKSGRWIESSWEEALAYSAERIQNELKQSDPREFAGIISPSSTLEEAYLFQKLLRGLGITAIDHRLRQSDFRDQENMPKFPQLGIMLKEIESQGLMVLVGTHIRKEQPVLALKIRKMVQMGGKVCVINPMKCEFNFDVAHHSVVTDGDLVLGLARLAKAIMLEKKIPVSDFQTKGLMDIDVQKVDQEMAQLLLNTDKKSLLIGSLGVSHPAFSELMGLLNLIAKLTGAKIGLLSDGPNAAGAWLAGCIPHRLPGGVPIEGGGAYTISDMWAHPLKNYILFNLEPDLDCLDGRKAVSALEKADFVLAINSYESPTLLSVADVLLPLSVFTENNGTWVNCEGQWQSFKAAVKPQGESRPGWEILNDFAKRFKHIINTNLTKNNNQNKFNFEFENIEAVKSELIQEIHQQSKMTVSGYSNFSASSNLSGDSNYSLPRVLSVRSHKNGSLDKKGLTRLAPVPLYASDALVRRASSLQKTNDKGFPIIYLNSNMIEAFKLTGTEAKVELMDSSAYYSGSGSGSGSACDLDYVILPYCVNEDIPDNTVLIEASLQETVSLGAPYALVRIGNV